MPHRSKWAPLFDDLFSTQVHNVWEPQSHRFRDFQVERHRVHDRSLHWQVLLVDLNQAIAIPGI
jgi:hypothetical protein